MLTKELLQELQQIFKEDYGIVLSENQTLEIANTLFKLSETLLKIDNYSE